MYITRSEAVEVLYSIINSGILDEELCGNIEEIANIIDHEDEDEISLWGAEDDAVDLFVAKREDLITPEWNKHCEDLYEKYKMK